MSQAFNSNQKYTDNSVLVSVWVITYNHERYIGEALDSILMQDVDFPYEIVVGEDCSTDSTREILLEYQQKHPDIIRLLLHKKNVGMIKNQNLTFRACRGKYIAMLEGDDYWTNRSKLKIQVRAMKMHPNCGLSFHSAHDASTGRVLGRRAKNDAVLPIDDFIKGGGYFCPTPSLMLKSHIVRNLPDFLDQAPAGDYYIQMLGALHGGLYIDQVMCAYRPTTEGSWSRSVKLFEKKQDFRIRTVYILEKMREYMPDNLDIFYVQKRFDLFVLIAFDYLIHGDRISFTKFFKEAQALDASRTIYYFVVYFLQKTPSVLRLMYSTVRAFRKVLRTIPRSKGTFSRGPRTLRNFEREL